MQHRQRGRCPECLRNVALLADGTVSNPHTGTDGMSKCRGYGKKAQPLASMPPPALVPPIRVQKNVLTGKWRVFGNGRYDSAWPTFTAAWVRVDELLEALRECE